MGFASLAEQCHRLVDNTGWGFWYRAVMLLFACITLALIAFDLSRFDDWLWGKLGVAFVSDP